MASEREASPPPNDAEPSALSSTDGERVAEPTIFERLADLGSVAQAAVPGLYAWAVTVAPVAWARGGGFFARAAALLGVAALLGAIALERAERWRTARLLSVWGLVATSAIVWLVGPTAAASRVDAARGISGMLGWGLFAYASAAPTYRRSPARPLFEGDELRARAGSPAGDRIYLAAAALVAIGLQVVGWYARTEERGLLVRLVTIAAAIGIVTHASQVSLARHKRGRPASSNSRRRAVVSALAAVSLVTALGIVLMLVR